MISTIRIMEEDRQTNAKAEREFRDFLQHGDDFFRIELWRPAKAWYRKALDLGIEQEKTKKKIAECDRLIAEELKVIRILAAIALAIGGLISILMR